MKKFKFLKISKTKKLRYISNYYKKNLYIIFLPGFASDIEGDKPKRFLNYAKKNKLGFLALEYSGHGKSSEKFIEGNISKWSEQTSKLIRKKTKGSNDKEFVAMVQPITGGNAPAAPPITIFWGVLLFNQIV